jgi:hypothetical protein
VFFCRHATNGAVLARCSQPEVGWLGWRSAEDEELIRAIADACAYDAGTDEEEQRSLNVQTEGPELIDEPQRHPRAKVTDNDALHPFAHINFAFSK